MNERGTIDVLNPSEDANFISRIFFNYLNSTFRKTNKNLLTEYDLFNPRYNDTAGHVASELEKQWNKEISSSNIKKPSLTRAIVRTYWKKFTILLFVPVIIETVKLLEALALGELLNYFSGNWTMPMAFLWAFLLFACSVTVTIMFQNYQYWLQTRGMRIRVACSSLIYKKLLRISSTKFSKIASGQVVNMISNDVTRFDFVTMFLPYLIITPLQLIAIVTFCWSKLGVYIFMGFLILFIMAALNPLLATAFRNLRKATAVLTDRRILFMSELLGAMQFIKMCCWERSFNRSIKDIRKLEIIKIWFARLLESIPIDLSTPSVKVALFMIISFRYLFTLTLPEASSVYQVLTLLQFVKVTLSIYVPLAVRFLSESLISIQRIQDFLLLEELTKGVETRIVRSEDNVTSSKSYDVLGNDVFEDCSDEFTGKDIQFSHYYGIWDHDGPEQFTLRNITSTVRRGSIVAVIGPVGSGKTSLLNAILKENIKLSGSLRCAGTISYAPQVAWIFTASLRQNILFGSAYDKRRYSAVLNACALDKDLKELPDGDRTILDDKGTRLSGGQRARVGLARAIYKVADIYLLDDPLSAVDTETSSYLFTKCFKGFLKGKTIILCTHHIQFLSAVDWTVVLKNGEIQFQGDFEALSKYGLNFSAYVSNDRLTDRGDILFMDSPIRASVSSHISFRQNQYDELLDSEFTLDKAKEKFIVGDVKYDVYLRYFLAATGSVVTFFLLLLLCACAEAVLVFTDWWLSNWLSIYHGSRNSSINNTTKTNQSIDYKYFGPYIGLTIGGFCGSIIRSSLFVSCAVNASRVLHNRMFYKILRAPMYFFTSNPMGVILNRFSKDIGIMDDIIPSMLLDAIFNSLNLTAMLIYLTVISPYTLTAVIPLIAFLWYLRRVYLKCSQNVKRLEGITRTPLFSHLSSTFQGLSTIRTFHLQKTVSKEFDEHLDFNNRAFTLFLSTQKWFQIRAECSCSIFMLVTSVIFIVVGGRFTAANIGLLLSYAVTMLGLVQWTIRQTAELVTQMTSVERVLEYSKLAEEPPLISDVRPPENWPSRGKLEFKHVFFRYSPDSPYILKDVNLVIRPGEKIGVVGRTGAGKSSFFNVIMRMGEIEGSYFIDDIDVLSLGLLDLRTKISVIPQEPVFFTGTLRSNLDPFDEFQDFQIWDALDQVELKPFVSELENGLNTKLSEGGSNLSTGQRQLLCLARALLRKCRIMLVDEATANVDKETDLIIQQTIRRRFKDYTVITIAHRLDTIIDSDYVLVFSNGVLEEFDHPYILLRDTSSYFYHLARELNAAEFSAVMSVAKRHWENKKRRKV